MGDRIAVMNKGRVMQVGSPIELYETPANTFVAGFIGSPRMNLLPAATLLAGSTRGDRRVAPPAGAVLGIRPEHVTIDQDDTFGIGSARVDRIEDLGHEALVHLTTATGAPLTARASREIRGAVAKGQTVALGIRPDRLHAFDETSGERLA